MYEIPKKIARNVNLRTVYARLVDSAEFGFVGSQLCDKVSIDEAALAAAAKLPPAEVAKALVKLKSLGLVTDTTLPVHVDGVWMEID